jgi:hypothetical protein
MPFGPVFWPSYALSLLLLERRSRRRRHPHREKGRRETFVALTEDGLASKVSRGENAGRRLQHTGVVRFLTSLGETDETDDVPLGKGWDHRALSIVAWVQERPCGPVLGAARLGITPSLVPSP